VLSRGPHERPRGLMKRDGIWLRYGPRLAAESNRIIETRPTRIDDMTHHTESNRAESHGIACLSEATGVLGSTILILYSTLRRWWRWISDLGYRFCTCLLFSEFDMGILFYFLNYGEMDEKLLWYFQVGQPLHWYEMLQATRTKQHRPCKCGHLPASILIWQWWLLVSA